MLKSASKLPVVVYWYEKKKKEKEKLILLKEAGRNLHSNSMHSKWVSIKNWWAEALKHPFPETYGLWWYLYLQV